MGAMQVVFETHFTTIDNEPGRATGSLPSQLSALGEAKARQLGRRHDDDGITAEFSSVLARAAQTTSTTG